MQLKIGIFCALIATRCFGTDLSLEEKVGQVLMVHFYGEEVNEEAKTLVQEVKVGGILYYNWANGLTSPAQVQNLSTGLQQLAKENRLPIPLLIAVDQEGGVVARLQSGFTIFPGNRALGETANPCLAQEAARVMGEELLAVGINMNLAPVVDVNSNPRNPVIGVRSFGDDPETVVTFGEKALAGFRQAGVIATLKHFPGCGDVVVDPHEDLPVIHKSQSELERGELLPFARLAASAEAIMTAHIVVPALDLEHCSTLSKTTLDYLREEIGFQGVIVSDSLVMEGVLKKCRSVSEAAIDALNAGCDLLILGGKVLVGSDRVELRAADIQKVHGSMVEAVKNGRISEERLNEAVGRILRLKEKSRSTDLESPVNTPEHRALAQKIATLALKVQQTHPVGSLKNQSLCVVAPSLLQPALEQTSLFQLGKSVDSYFFQGLNPSNAEMEVAKQRAEKAEVVIVCLYNAWKNPSVVALTRSLFEINKRLILFSLRDPLDVSLFPEAEQIFTSFSPTVVSIQAICDRIAHEMEKGGL